MSDDERLLEPAALRDALARQQATLDALHRITATAASAANLTTILQMIYEETTRLMSVESFVGALYDEGRNEVELAIRYDMGEQFPPLRIPYAPEGSLVGWIIAHQQPLLIRDTLAETLPVAGIVFGDERPIRSWLGVPMDAQGQIVGALSVQSYTPNAFDSAAQRLLVQIGQQAALAIIIQQGRAEFEQYVEELTLLNDLSREVSSAITERPLAALLELIRQRLAMRLNTEHFYVAIFDEPENTVYFPLVVEDGQPIQRSGRQAARHFTEHLIAGGVPLRLNGNVDEYAQDVGIERSGRVANAWLGVPLWMGGAVIGAIVIQSHRPDASYSAEDERLLVAVAAQAAGVIQIAWLLEDEQRRRSELEAANRRQTELLGVIREISTPIIPLFQGVLALPLIGSIDDRRAAQITEALLHEITHQRAQIVLLDVTGVAIVDTAVANYLLQAIQATELLGAACILVGIRPEVAQTIVGLGVNLEGVATMANLQEGLTYALARLGLRITTRT